MKYKIEIWQWYNITETYESDDIADILKWYRGNWYWEYERGGCSFAVCENGRELSFEEKYVLGFYK